MQGTGHAKFLNIPDYQTVCIQTEVLTRNLLLLLLYLGVQLIRGLFHLGISWYRVIKVLIFVFWSLHTWSRWKEARGQEIPQQLVYRHSWRPFEHVREIYPFKWWNFILVKIKTSCLGDYSQGPDYQDFWIIRHWIKGILLYYVIVSKYRFSQACVCAIHFIYFNIVNYLVHSNFEYVQTSWEHWELCLLLPVYLQCIHRVTSHLHK